jgi:hypothetical protein
VINFPCIAQIEQLFVRYFAPSADDHERMPEKWREMIDDASREVFGVTRDETFLWEPEELADLPDDHPDVLAFQEKDEAHEAHFGPSGIVSYQKQLDMLAEAGFDFRDEQGIRLRVLDHFFRQAIAAGKGLMGRIADIAEVDTASWARKLEREAKSFSANNTRRKAG